jgi:hypothetical protein
MANISLVHDNVLSGGSQVTATGVEAGSNAGYLYDDRLSFKFITAGSATQIQINQPNDNARSWRKVAIMDHTDLEGGEVRVFGYSSISRTTPVVVISGAGTSDNPMVFDAGATQSYQFLDIEIDGPVKGTGYSFGEILVGDQFDSPQRPGIGISTTYVPRSTFITLPNGERQTIKHAEVARVKQYTIPGLSYDQAAEWSGVFVANEGSQLVLLTDENGNQFPAMMGQELSLNDETKIVSIDLVFEEVKV